MKIKASINLWEESFGTPFSGNQPVAEEKVGYPEGGSFQVIPVSQIPSTYPPFVFIDGVMRKDAGLYFEMGTELIKASLFSVASGAVVTHNQKVNLLPEQLIAHHIKRYLILEQGRFCGEIEDFWQKTLPGLQVQVVSCRSKTFDDFQTALNLMRELEGKIVQEILPHIPAFSIIITDGNLHFPTYPYPVVGLIKSIAKPYPDERLFQENRWIKLKEKRSSIFEISGNNNRLSWYISLADNQYISWFNHLARLEVYPNVGLEEAVRIADSCALFLPDFALQHVSRYPQNLAPVYVLERELTSLLGNKNLIKNMLLEGLL